MFIGHFATAFGAKALLKNKAPALSLGTAFLAAQFVDLLWPTLLLAGIERVEINPGDTAFTPLNFVFYPISHSLVSVVFWSSIFAMAYVMIRRNVAAAVTVGLLVLSHWLLDLVTHRPDLPLVPGGRVFVGLGLWNSVAWTLILEFGLYALGVWLYTRATVAKNRTGTWALWALVAFLAVVHIGNAFGPPPPSVQAIAVAGHSMWLLVLWGYWIDRNRVTKSARPVSADGQ
jgi:hypothetical protein